MRLIDADELRKKWIWGSTDRRSEVECIELPDLDDAPTIDAEPVVRCRDCKYCSIDRYADGNVPDYVCIEMDCGVEADDYCSIGERKDDE